MLHFRALTICDGDDLVTGPRLTRPELDKTAHMAWFKANISLPSRRRMSELYVGHAASDIPSAILHVPNLRACLGLRVPNDYVLQILCNDMHTTARPCDVVLSGRVLVHRIGKFEHIYSRPRFHFSLCFQLLGRLGLVIVIDSLKWRDVYVARRSADVCMEQSLEFKRTSCGKCWILDMKVSADLMFREGHDVFQCKRLVEFCLDAWRRFKYYSLPLAKEYR